MALKYFLGGWLRTNIDVVSFSGSAQLGSEEYASHLSSSFQHYEIYNIGGKVALDFEAGPITLPYDDIPDYDSLGIEFTGSLKQSICDNAGLPNTSSFQDIYRLQVTKSGSYAGTGTWMRDWVNGVLQSEIID